MISIQNIAIVFVARTISRTAPCFVSCEYVVKEFVPFVSHVDEVIGNAHWCVFLLDVSIRGTKC